MLLHWNSRIRCGQLLSITFKLRSLQTLTKKKQSESWSLLWMHFILGMKETKNILSEKIGRPSKILSWQKLSLLNFHNMRTWKKYYFQRKVQNFLKKLLETTTGVLEQKEQGRICLESCSWNSEINFRKKNQINSQKKRFLNDNNYFFQFMTVFNNM